MDPARPHTICKAPSAPALYHPPLIPVASTPCPSRSVFILNKGGVLACATFVIQSSRNNVVRAMFAGDSARSNTLYGGHQRRKLEQSGRKIQVTQLQGNVFFANVQQVRDQNDGSDRAKENIERKSFSLCPRQVFRCFALFLSRCFSPISTSSASVLVGRR